MIEDMLCNASNNALCKLIGDFVHVQVDFSLRAQLPQRSVQLLQAVFY